MTTRAASGPLTSHTGPRVHDQEARNQASNLAFRQREQSERKHVLELYRFARARGLVVYSLSPAAAPGRALSSSSPLLTASFPASLNASSALLAAPLRMLSLASSTPCFSSLARPATTRRAAALRTTKVSTGCGCGGLGEADEDEDGESSSERRRTRVSEFSSGVPPATVLSGVAGRPKSRGWIVRGVTTPSRRSQTCGCRRVRERGRETETRQTHVRVPRGADLVEPLGATDDPRPLDASDPQRLCKDGAQVGRVDADDHGLGPGRVDQGPERVEHGRERELLPDWGDADHGGVVQRGEEEHEGRAGRDGREGRGGEGRDGAAEREEDVGRARRRRRGLVAVLCRERCQWGVPAVGTRGGAHGPGGRTL